MSQPPIERYALLSDRQTAALVADGCIDWLCVPRFDSPAVFARLLGDSGNGYWRVVPVDGVCDGRRYRDGSFVLDTDWTTPAGSVTTTDFLTHGKDDSNDPGVGVVRRVECTAGSVDVEVDLVMRFDYGRTAPWVRRTHDPSGAEVVRATAGPHSLTLHGPRLTGRDATHHGRFHLEAGQTLTWSLTWRPSHLAVPVAPDVDAELAWLTRT